MKNIFIWIAIILVTGVCKKDKASSANCDLPKKIASSPDNGNTYKISYEYNSTGSIKSVTEKYPASELKWERSYENGGQRVIVTSALNATAKDTFELNSDGYIIYWVHQLSNGPGYFYYTYDGNGFLASVTNENFNTGSRILIGKYQENFTNTIVNGNLAKRIRVYKDIKAGTTNPPETKTWEYDESKSASPLFTAYFTEFNFTGRGLGKKSKNAAVKSYINGVQYNYTYVSDTKGKLKELNGIYMGSGTAYSNQKYIYTYL
jgi:hypothetical protein